MERGNQTGAGNFILLGFYDDPDLQSLLFGLLLSMYLVTVLGNLLIILATISNSHLHTPMHFFLSNLSLADIGFTSTTIPKALRNIQTQSKVLTFAGCISQICSFFVFLCQDNLCRGCTLMAEDPELHSLIFGNFLFKYLFTVLGNLLIIMVTNSDSHLQTPMYFFLSHLSFVDICFTSNMVPKKLVNIQAQSKAVTYQGCIIQIYFFELFVLLDNFFWL
ncbi:Olfactory receptor 7C2 [Sciurus carolinensis]|uniref:Olfactory receptor 7C2 n=1 Tax=Sciurus carolinensis TaxID=30640 RepID=A0AA41MRG4_SCICA|nr:Olfactory receptor 7C2 [Sciurus carolinensis]